MEGSSGCRNVVRQLGVSYVASKYDFIELKPGDIIKGPFGQYKVLTPLSYGRCCEVFEGENIEDKSHVALKVFRHIQDYRGALQRELIFMEHLKSQNEPVVKLLGSICCNGKDILIYELLSGTLKDIFLHHEGSFCSPWLISALAFHVTRALAFLHKKGVVHADLKPMNIMWNSKFAQFTLIDFGLSFSIIENYFHTIQSKGYQAPESAIWNDLKDKHTTERKPSSAVDIWSLGCIVAELATGEKPFRGSEMSLTFKSNFLCLYSVYPQDFVNYLNKFLIRCLALNSADRATAKELLDEELFHLQHLMPSLKDFMLLPTCVLRFLEFVNPLQFDGLSESLIAEFIEKCRRLSAILKYFVDSQTGNLFIEFRSSLDAEIVHQHLRKTMFHGRTVISTFYLPQLLQK